MSYFSLTHCQDFGRTPSYLERMKAEAQEEARRWQQEQEAELRRKEAMKLSDEERLDILQVNNSYFLNNHIDTMDGVFINQHFCSFLYFRYIQKSTSLMGGRGHSRGYLSDKETQIIII